MTHKGWCVVKHQTNKQTTSTLWIRTLVPEEVFSEKGRISAKKRDWEAPVSRMILIGVDWAKSLFSDTGPSDKNGS